MQVCPASWHKRDAHPPQVLRMALQESPDWMRMGESQAPKSRNLIKNVIIILLIKVFIFQSILFSRKECRGFAQQTNGYFPPVYFVLFVDFTSTLSAPLFFFLLCFPRLTHRSPKPKETYARPRREHANKLIDVKNSPPFSICSFKWVIDRRNKIKRHIYSNNHKLLVELLIGDSSC